MRVGCGATGNCPFWAFQKSGNGFEKILDTRGKDGIGGIEVFTIEADTTNGFHDLVLGAHDSASERTLLLYRYDGKKYRVSGCYLASWVSTENGRWQQLKLPEITPCSNK
jgi:hypothetical protein